MKWLTTLLISIEKYAARLRQLYDVSYDQVGEGQISRGGKLPFVWPYSESGTGQEIEGAAEVAVALSNIPLATILFD